MAEQFERVKDNHPSRNVFDLSYEKKFTADFGYLYPVMCDEVIPGDVFNIGCEAVIRSQPLLAPILHRIDVKVEYFFVPYRILWDDWEEFITGGEDGYTPVTNPGHEPVPPVWYPRTSTFTSETARGSLFDFLYGVDVGTGGAVPAFDRNIWPSDFPRRAYNLIWWENYRDENLQINPLGVNLSLLTDKAVKGNFVGMRDNSGEVSSGGRETTACLRGNRGNNVLLRRSWEKDFFTSALPYQQKGDTPALPVSGVVPVSLFDTGGLLSSSGAAVRPVSSWVPTGFSLSYRDSNASSVASGAAVIVEGSGVAPSAWNNNSALLPLSVDRANALAVDLDGATTFDVSDLRLAFQTQRWLEQNARAGTRYTEFLRAHYGVSPHDDRLQRPELIGKVRMPMIISEVLQTSETTDPNSPQGNMAGHGITVSGNRVGSYRVTEYGLILGLLSFVPKPAYQQGINKQWLRRTPLDYYFPEFAHLSERGIESQELFWTPLQSTANNVDIFGFQGIYDEMRVKNSMVHGLFRDSSNTTGLDGFGYWHLGRYFTSRPTLSSAFIEIDSDGDFLKRAYSVPSEPPFFVSYGNNIRAVRPMPWKAEPGLIDHV